MTDFKAVIEMPKSKGLAEAIKKESFTNERARADIKEIQGKIIITITASDAVALRASLNGVMQLVAVYEKINKIR